MLNIINKSFRIFKNNLLFIQPLLLFILVILSVVSYSAGKILLVPAKIILSVSMILLFVSFISGWFYINKLAVKDYSDSDAPEEVTAKSINNFKKFFEGTGANFLKFLFAFAIVSIIGAFAGYFLYKFCMKFYGTPSLLYELPKIANAVSQAERLNIINSIPLESQITITKWFFTFNTASVIATFAVNMYFTIITFENENIFKSLIRTIIFTFKNIFGVIVLILFLQLLYIVLNLVSMIAGFSIIALFIMIMLFTMYLNYCLILLFCFYDEKTKDNSNNGTECVGEN